MDEIDQAQEHMERQQVGLLAQRRPIGPLYTGWCAYCEEFLGGEARFCDTDCRDGYDRVTAARARNGRSE